jgi:hypothetical protein
LSTIVVAPHPLRVKTSIRQALSADVLQRNLGALRVVEAQLLASVSAEELCGPHYVAPPTPNDESDGAEPPVKRSFVDKLARRMVAGEKFRQPLAAKDW